MSFLKASFPVTRLAVTTDLDDAAMAAGLEEMIKQYAFNPKLESGKGNSGTVLFDDLAENDFSDPDRWRGGSFIFFGLRIDERKVPAAYLKMEKDKAEKEFLAQNPGLQRVPKMKKQEIADKVELELMAQTPPTPSLTQIVWDERTREFLVASTGKGTIENVCALLKRIEGLRLREVAPFARYRELSASEPWTAPVAKTLEDANLAGTDATLDLIESNLPVWQDFLAWLTWRTFNSSSEYEMADGGKFVAYATDSFTLDGPEKEKVVISGPQERHQELKAALRDGKRISRIRLALEKGEDCYVVTLPARTLSLHRLKTPPVLIERDAMTDPHLERVATLFERLHMIDEAQEMLDALVLEYWACRHLDDGAEWSRSEQFRSWIEEAS